MFTNYHYFLVLAKEGNMTRSAEHLFISHQNLSKYLSNLETDFGITLFERKPSFWLTSAEQSMYEALCQVKSLERNLRDDRGGEITLGTTEGRFRSLMPNLINDFKNASSDVHLRIVSAASPELQET
ncbi:LysR family transcriptional regulator [Oscillibacter sp.]|uniref:LysR family transcriptional regulator n=1 Tax=Oscillibacter sp. TaxID=1945593 RepID=UPI00289F0949|nr:LysR family transcriptional regulator [Oscillibacter sp.]